MKKAKGRPADWTVLLDSCAEVAGALEGKDAEAFRAWLADLVDRGLVRVELDIINEAKARS